MMNNMPFYITNPLASPKIWFYTTNQCNIHCKYCFNYIDKNHEHMSAELALAIFKKCLEHQQESQVKHPFLHLLFFGGEPTLNPQPIFALLNYAKKHNLKILPQLLTNGIMKTETLDKLIAEQVFFQVSFDGYQNNLRLGNKEGSDLNKHVIHALEKISAHKEIPLTIRATIHSGNLDNMEEIFDLAAQFNTKTIIFQPTFAEGNAIKYSVEQPNIQKFIQNFDAVKIKAEKLNIQVACPLNINSLPSNQEKYYLPLVWLPDGSLSFTIRYASTKVSNADKAIIGKFNQEQQKIILNTERLQEMQADFLQARSKYCHGCSVYDKCQGKNNFDPYTLNKTVNIGDYYLCEVSRIFNSDSNFG